MFPRAVFVRRFAPASRLVNLAVFAGCLACGGAPGAQPPLYAVKGKVLYQGKPITGGVVVYELESSNAPELKSAQGNGPLRATGRIEADGGFQLIAYPGAEGVPAGSYKVGISSVPPRTEGNLFEAAKSAMKGNPDVLRGRYADPSKSGLRDKVADDRVNEPTFELK
jgi:hypothetical protein